MTVSDSTRGQRTSSFVYADADRAAYALRDRRTLRSQVQRRLLDLPVRMRRIAIAIALVVGALGIALVIGIAGPLLALVAATAVVGGVLIVADTHWGFVALAGVVYGLPFATLPVDIGFKPTLLNLALAALFFVWIGKLAVGFERRFVASPVGGAVAVFILLALFSFVFGLTHSRATLFTLRRFLEIVLGITMFFVTINTVQSRYELAWITRWLLLASGGCAAIAVLFYVIPEELTVAILDRLVRLDYPGGFGALRWIEDDPEGTMRAIGTAVDPNVLGGMMILSIALSAPQLFAKKSLLPRSMTIGIFLLCVLALYLTYSRSALLGMASVLAMMALVRYRKLLVVGAIGALLFLFLPQTQAYLARLMAGFTNQDLATQMRWGEYKDAWMLIQRYPLFGVGFTGVPDIDLYLGVSMLYMIIAENMGLIGLFAFLAVVIVALVWFVRSWRSGLEPGLEALLLGYGGAIAGVLVSGLFDHYWFNMTYPHMTVLFWWYLGLAAATVLIQRDEQLYTAIDRSSLGDP